MASGMTIAGLGLSPLDLLATNQSAPGKLSATTQTKAHAAAQNFESVFLNTMFQQMFTGIDGDGPFGGRGATKVWRSMLTDEYAKSFAKAGGVGIANHVYQTLMAQQEQQEQQKQ